MAVYNFQSADGEPRLPYIDLHRPYSTDATDSWRETCK